MGAVLASILIAPVRPAGAQGPGAFPKYSVTDSLVVGHAEARHLDLDVVNRRLYGGGNAIVDIDRKQVTGRIADSTPGTSYFVAAETDRGLTNTGEIFNPATGAVGEHLPAHGAGIAYDPLTRRAFLLQDSVTVVSLAGPAQPYVMGGQRGRGGFGGRGTTPPPRGGPDTVIRRLPPVRLTASIVGHLYLRGVGSSGWSDGRGRVYLALTSADSLAIVDTDKLKLLGIRSVAPCKAPVALAADNASHRLYIGCDGQVVVLALDNGIVVAALPAAGRIMQIAFDPGAQLLFVPSAGQGILVFHEDTRDKYSVVQTIDDPRVTGASAVVLDPTTHRLFVPHQAADGTLSFLVVAPEI